MSKMQDLMSLLSLPELGFHPDLKLLASSVLVGLTKFVVVQLMRLVLVDL